MNPFQVPDFLAIALSTVPYVLGLFAFLAAVRIIRRILTARAEVARGFDNVVLLVTVPKESGEKDGGQRDKSLQEIQAAIAVAEGVFKSVGGLKAERGFRAWLAGRGDVIAFEIVATAGLVSFYIAVPKRFREFMEQQVHAQYPLAQIEEVSDYNVFQPNGTIASAHLVFGRENFFPIHTYKKLETDPLNALTNALAKVEAGDGAAIQILVRSAKKSWREKGVKIASLMQQGRSYAQARKGSGVIKRASQEEKTGEKAKDYRLSPLEEQMVKSIEEKVGQLGLDANVNLVASSPTPGRAELVLGNLIGAFNQFSSPQYGNAFKRISEGKSRIVSDFILRIFHDKRRMVLTPDELASLWHLPLSSTETPNIRWLTARKAPPPSNLPKEGLLLGVVKYRGQEHAVRIKQADRRRHMYIIGKSGSGKSELIKSMVRQDIEAGRGVCVIDPHGDLAQDCLAFVPKERADDVIYFSPADSERPMGLNLLEYDERYPEQKTFVVNEMLKIFDKLYDLKSTGGPMFEQYMRNAMILVMDDPASGSTLMEIPRVLSDERFRAYKLSKCKTQVVKDFWLKEASKAGGEASLANMVPYITSKLTPFITNDIVRPIIGQQKSAINVREAMDQQKILLLDLSKGKLGDLNAYLIGMVLVGKILMAALSRTDLSAEERKDFYLYIDEFQNFITDSISTILSEARKYGLDLTIAHQYIGQISQKGDTAIRDAVFGNVGTMVAFRVGPEDADFLGKEFAPVFTPFDLVNVEAYTANTKLLIDNTASRPFNMAMGPLRKPDTRLTAAIKQLSRLKYGRDREIVEAEIRERLRLL
ncbi:MAG: type IV secretion system DNA-binding domain-containing protein [Patescibacteria group bacterium]|nr:MAG: type IV secretion system DNA-binding domain-containing protein [Patescibacteria group bacterium]